MISKNDKTQKVKEQVNKTMALLDNHSTIEENNDFQKIMALSFNNKKTFNFSEYFTQYSRVVLIAAIILLNIISTYITMNTNNKQTITTSKSYISSLSNHYDNNSSNDYMINITKEKWHGFYKQAKIKILDYYIIGFS